jgi:hypothetical protein
MNTDEQTSNSQLEYILLKSTVLESLQALKGLESDNRKPQFWSDFALSLSSSGQTPGSAASAHLRSLESTALACSQHGFQVKWRNSSFCRTYLVKR